MMSSDVNKLIFETAREADYPALAALWNAVYPEDSYSAEEFRYLDTVHEPPCRCARFVGRLGGEVVASASYMQFVGMYHPHKFMVNVFVHPERRRAGIGGALYRDLLDTLTPFDPLSLSALARESEPEAVRFAERRGYAETKRDWQAVLDLASFDPTPFAGLELKLRAEGVTLLRFPEVPADPGFPRAFHALFSELRQDVPRTEPATPIALEQFEKVVLGAPDFYPDGLVLAVAGGGFVGMTMFWKGEQNEALHTGLTGVKRAYRGRGVATALKVKALVFGQTLGVPKVYTDNDTHNLEMIRVNEKLGFVRQPALIGMRLRLGEEGTP